ncbi:hypothetical protein Bbelb_346660 [Branchiostoma belcheri]|nr:hypothetical protein Bbelb_346660 [Branchiostoma belcheri]
MKYSDRLLFQQLGRWVTVQQPKNVGSSYANICFEMRILCWEWRSCLHSLIFSCDLIRFTATWPDREEGLETGLEKSWSQSALQLAPTGDCSMNYSCLVCQC